MKQLKKLLKSKTKECTEYLNIDPNSMYRWNKIPRKYHRPMIEFLEWLAADLLKEAQKLYEKKV